MFVHVVNKQIGNCFFFSLFENSKAMWNSSQRNAVESIQQIVQTFRNELESLWNNIG